MPKMTAQDVLKTIKTKNVKFIKIWFVDILGNLKSMSITDNEVEAALKEGMGFDGSSIEGFCRIFESDLVVMPDPSTFQMLPWRPDEDGVARMFCDIVTPDGKPYEGDTRHILKRNLAKAKKMGFDYFVGPELEYFYFKNDEGTEIIDKGGYFDILPLDEADDLRRDTILTLEKMGVQVEYSHHEVAPSQHEIDLRYCDALSMADNVMTYKTVVKQVAHKHGVYATFMPKPIAGVNGSGMHVHQSLFKGPKNAFYDPKGQNHLSAIAKSFIAGTLRHVKEMTAVTNQWINSYRRLVPGFEAPCYIAWGQKNRSALVRVPIYKPGNEKATRIELRFPDPACNPYLAFSVMLAAGLKGVEEKLELEPPVEKDIFKLSAEAKKAEGIKELPADLYGATLQLEKSELMREAMGEHAFKSFVANKKKECDDFRLSVTDYELKRYLPVL